MKIHGYEVFRMITSLADIFKFNLLILKILHGGATEFEPVGIFCNCLVVKFYLMLISPLVSAADRTSCMH